MHLVERLTANYMRMGGVGASCFDSSHQVDRLNFYSTLLIRPLPNTQRGEKIDMVARNLRSIPHIYLDPICSYTREPCCSFGGNAPRDSRCTRDRSGEWFHVTVRLDWLNVTFKFSCWVIFRRCCALTLMNGASKMYLVFKAIRRLLLYDNNHVNMHVSCHFPQLRSS